MIPTAYPGIWASTGSAGPADPHFANVINLSHFDGTNGSTTFVDSSSHATNLTNGGTTAAISTTQSKFGGASLSAPSGGANGVSGSQSFYAFGNGDYTVEFWAFMPNLTNAMHYAYWGDGQSNGIFSAAGGNLVVVINGANTINSGTPPTANAWNFIAYSVISGNGVLYLAGSNIGSAADGGGHTGTNLLVGFKSGTVLTTSIFIDDYRATAFGRYSGSTCPVPTAAFPNH